MVSGYLAFCGTAITWLMCTPCATSTPRKCVLGRVVMYSSVSALNTLTMASAHPTRMYFVLATIQLAALVRHMTHLSSSRRALNSTRCPLRVIAYVLSAISPFPQATAQKSLFRSSPRIALRPISGIGSLYFRLPSRYQYLTCRLPTVTK
uniref:Putative secreted protein n=1 Tax=Anopheles darlingi TaxID=43151 RepID=A0A2M4DHD2_ANODA